MERTARQGAPAEPRRVLHADRSILESCGRARLVEEAFGAEGNLLADVSAVPGKHVSEEFFTYRLGDPWAAQVLQPPWSARYRSDDEVFDLLELLCRDVVSYPTQPGVRPS